MRIGVVTENYPNPATGGGALTAWTIVQDLARRGHDITLVALLQPANETRAEEERGRLQALERSGIRVRPLSIPPAVAEPPRTLLQRARPALDRAFPGIRVGDSVSKVLDEAGVQVLLAYHWLGIGAIRGCRAPKMATAGDPSELALRARSIPMDRDRLRARAWLQAARAELGVLARLSLYRELLAPFDSVGLFAAHHAAWLRAHGVPSCKYLRTPTPDETGPSWEKLRDEHARPGPPTILHIGHLRGTSTIAGLRLLAKEILPALTEEFGPDGFRLRIVGGYAPPPDIARMLDQPAVELVGHVEPGDVEFLRADAIIVPTPVRLGIRVRIVTAWSFGTPVVAHVANTAGIPEMRQGENAMLGTTGRELAKALINVLQDPRSRRDIGRQGRATYERWFQPDRAVRAIEQELIRISEN